LSTAPSNSRANRSNITRENTDKIKAAVNALRRDLERAQSDNLIRSRPDITSLQIRFDAYCDDIRRLIHHAKFEEKQPAIKSYEETWNSTGIAIST
jgi:hypothetical protein